MRYDKQIHIFHPDIEKVEKDLVPFLNCRNILLHGQTVFEMTRFEKFPDLFMINEDVMPLTGIGQAIDFRDGYNYFRVPIIMHCPELLSWNPRICEVLKVEYVIDNFFDHAEINRILDKLWGIKRG